jgi:hypothetical protein
MTARPPSKLARTLLALSVVALASTPALAQKKGGTLTIATEAEFSGFNHLKAKIFNQNTSAPASSVMETLFAYEGRRQHSPLRPEGALVGAAFGTGHRGADELHRVAHSTERRRGLPPLAGRHWSLQDERVARG